MLQTRDLIWTMLLVGHAGKDANKIFIFFFVYFFWGGVGCYEGIQLLRSCTHRFGPDAVLTA